MAVIRKLLLNSLCAGAMVVSCYAGSYVYDGPINLAGELVLSDYDSYVFKNSLNTSYGAKLTANKPVEIDVAPAWLNVWAGELKFLDTLTVKGNILCGNYDYTMDIYGKLVFTGNVAATQILPSNGLLKIFPNQSGSAIFDVSTLESITHWGKNDKQEDDPNRIPLPIDGNDITYLEIMTADERANNSKTENEINAIRTRLKNLIKNDSLNIKNMKIKNEILNSADVSGECISDGNVFDYQLNGTLDTLINDELRQLCAQKGIDVEGAEIPNINLASSIADCNEDGKQFSDWPDVKLPITSGEETDFTLRTDITGTKDLQLDGGDKIESVSFSGNNSDFADYVKLYGEKLSTVQFSAANSSYVKIDASSINADLNVFVYDPNLELHPELLGDIKTVFNIDGASITKSGYGVILNTGNNNNVTFNGDEETVMTYNIKKINFGEFAEVTIGKNAKVII